MENLHILIWQIPFSRQSRLASLGGVKWGLFPERMFLKKSFHESKDGQSAGDCREYLPPATKFAKVMFSQVSVHRRGGGRCLPHCMLGYKPPWPEADTPTPGADTPLGADTPCPPPSRHYPRADTPRDQTPLALQGSLGDTGNKRAVRILLECILV